mmetsp:Transcript_26997/g.27480  ORF Transcript_26997/g.27480 Transcript_26997/m.27480 type:complete len:138 (-) Transcript_26997:255-668(-)
MRMVWYGLPVELVRYQVTGVPSMKRGQTIQERVRVRRLSACARIPVPISTEKFVPSHPTTGPLLLELGDRWLSHWYHPYQIQIQPTPPTRIYKTILSILSDAVTTTKDIVNPQHTLWICSDKNGGTCATHTRWDDAI